MTETKEQITRRFSALPTNKLIENAYGELFDGTDEEITAVYLSGELSESPITIEFTGQAEAFFKTEQELREYLIECATEVTLELQ